MLIAKKSTYLEVDFTVVWSYIGISARTGILNFSTRLAMFLIESSKYDFIKLIAQPIIIPKSMATIQFLGMFGDEGPVGTSG